MKARKDPYITERQEDTIATDISSPSESRKIWFCLQCMQNRRVFRKQLNVRKDLKSI